VRLGHKTRDAALAELDDDIDPERMRRLLSDIGSSEARIATADAPAVLAAFYVAAGTLTDDEIRRQLLERVPAYLVPTHLHRVSSIPLTINGKVDEAALLQEAPDRGAARPPYSAPEGPVAERLAALWEEELGAERIGMADNFFALGGTSLTAMQMIVRLCRHFAVDLPLATVFTHSRLADLARVAEDRILADVEGDASPR
jgi:enterobactin synthetase component F